MCGPLEGPRVCCIVLGLHCNTAGRALDYPQGAAAKAAGKAQARHNSDAQQRPAPGWGPRSAPPGPSHRDRHGPGGQSPRGPEPQAAHDQAASQAAKQARGVVFSCLLTHPGS